MTHHQAVDARAADGLQELGADLTRFLMEHKFGVDEITTKSAILQEEFTHLHDYNPIDHLESRVKSPQSIREKARRRGIELSIQRFARTSPTSRECG